MSGGFTCDLHYCDSISDIKNVIFRSVSWIRGGDSHIITVDEETFISDDRFSSLVKTQDNLWTLKVGGDEVERV